MRYIIFVLACILTWGLTGCNDPVAVAKVDVKTTPLPVVPPIIPSVTPPVTTTVPPIPAGNPLHITPATNVTTTSALLNGSVDVNYLWGASGNVKFQLALYNPSGVNWDASVSVSLAGSNGHPHGVVQSLVVPQLSSRTTYSYRLVLNTGNSDQGVFYSDVSAFTTSASSIPSTTSTTSVPPTSVATVRAFASTGVTATSATLHGSINYVWGTGGTSGFQWIVDDGQTINWQNSTTEFFGHASGNIQLSLVDRLRPNTNYAYRLFVAPGDAIQPIPSDFVIRFTTLAAAQAMSVGQMVAGFAPSPLAPTTQVLPTASSIVVETQGYTNLGQDYVTLHGYVDVPRGLTVAAQVFFQTSVDGTNWTTWYNAGTTLVDERVPTTIGGLGSNTLYYYRVGAGFSPENSTYGYPRSFTTLASSDTRAGQLKNLSSIVDQINSLEPQVATMVTYSGMSPKTVQSVSQSYVDVLAQGRVLVDLSTSPDVDGAISEDLAGRIIAASDTVDTLRSKADLYFNKVYRAEFSHPNSTSDPAPVPQGVGAANVGSSGQSVKSVAAKMVGASIDQSQGVEVPDYLIVDILRGLVAGVNALCDRTRDVIYRDYNNVDTWTESYGTYLANQAFVAARVLHDLSVSPGVADLIDTNLRHDLSGVDSNIKSLRTDFRGLQDRANLYSRTNSRFNSDRLQRRYIDGESYDGGKG
ncbi:MAG: hypothetical protein HY226_02975 [Candidatus Vogelbacteria bacterium]|nr:hypothetical protein [Candidatus Vogelbacteria bacterium]